MLAFLVRNAIGGGAPASEMLSGGARELLRLVSCGCSEICEVCTSFGAMPLVFSAASTAFIALALASLAARAVFASVVTPASISARSGAADTVASLLTEIDGGTG